MTAKRLTDKEKKKVIADYIDTGNYSETGRMNGISDVAVRRIVEKDPEVSKLLEEKKIENTQSTIEYMQTQHETKKKILDKILKAIEEKAENVDMFTNIKDLATAYGIIIDKELKALELQRNSGTSNSDLQKVNELLSKIEEEANK